MNVYLAFHPGDVSLTLRLLGWINELGGRREHTLVLVADAAVDSISFFQCQELAERKESPFASVDSVISGLPVNGWIPGSNTLWLLAAQHAETHGIPHWLFIEPDAVPVRRTWIEDIDNQYRQFCSRYIGAIVHHDKPNLPNPYLEGCAVYPGNAFSELGSLVRLDQSWTLTTAGKVVQQARNSPLFQHLWGEAGKPPTFALKGVPGTEVFGLDYIKPTTALFHRNKDGSLIQLLRKQFGFVRGVSGERFRYVPFRQIVTVRRSAAIGDVLCASTVAERLLQQGYQVRYEAHPDTHCVMRRHRVEMMMVPVGRSPIVHANLDGAYENDQRRRFRHFHEMFFEVAGVQLSRHGITLGPALNCTPRMVVEPNEENTRLLPYPRPWVFICPQSNSWANRTVPGRVWAGAAPLISGTCFWLGTNDAPPGIVDLKVRHMDTLIRVMSHADLVVTVDTGPMHIAAALRIPMVVINQSSFAEHHLSDQNDFITVAPQLDCLDCQQGQCPKGNPPPCQNISPILIAQEVNAHFSGGVSVVVSIYKPSVTRLNRCLEAVLPQVREIIVVNDLAGLVPAGALQHPKIRYVTCPKVDIGYGRKVNHGARHTHGEWIWTLNDDCYVEPTTLQRMLEIVTPAVGMVAHELRYPNGLIQHGGTYRNPGDIGWGHLDHNARESRIKAPCEMENVTGASVMIRRKAFYEADAFDEEFHLYCEDNAMCLQVRKAGWKILYTPFGKAIHDEHQSTKMTPNMHAIMLNSHAVLKRKWGAYFKHNANRVPGTFDY